MSTGLAASKNVSCLPSEARMRSRSFVAHALAVVVILGAATPPNVARAQAPPFLTQWGSCGSGTGQFNGPGGIAVDASGNVYVADFETTASRSSRASATSLPSGAGQFVPP